MTPLRALLNVHSYFSFGRGASSPAALIERTATLGYTHVGLTDELGVYGVVELHRVAKEKGLGAVVSATVPLLHEGEVYPVVLLASSKRGYGTLNDLITLAKAGEGGVTLSVLEACRQIAVWQRQSGRRLNVNVNVSSQGVRPDGLCRRG